VINRAEIILDNEIAVPTTRCWGAGEQDYHDYHDFEWGRPDANDIKLFEKMTLESFQSGLSWLTILRKRVNFFEAFAEFDFEKVAKFDDKDVDRLLLNSGIVRHRGKIEATINNARIVINIIAEFGSFSAYIWQWEPKDKEPHEGKSKSEQVNISITATSKKLSLDLKSRGWKFFGPTTAYSFMQAAGLINDHGKGCFCYLEIEKVRTGFVRPRVIT
jgi:DNA-3-methyladenine glycosylase I